MWTKGKVISLILAITVATLFSGCTKEPQVAMQGGAKGQPHIEGSKHIKRVMQDMSSVLYERHKSELERDEQRQRYAYKLSATLMTLSQEIKKYPQEDDHERFNTLEKRGDFLSLADQLRLHGDNIKSIASTYNMKALNEEIQNMTKTCNRCHAQFNPNGRKIQ